MALRMIKTLLPPDDLPPLSLSREEFVFPMKVHCSFVGCRWSIGALDADDAVECLSDHLTLAHGIGTEDRSEQ